MSNLDFQAMSRKELLGYIRTHPTDNEAFHIFMDRAKAEPATEIYPAPQSIDDLKDFPQLLEKHQKQQKGN